MIDALLAKFYKAIIIVLMAFLLVLSLAVGVQTWRIGGYQVDQANSNQVRAEAVEKAVKPYKEAIAKAQNEAITKEREYAQNLLKAEQNAIEKIKVADADADRANTAANSLSKQLEKAKRNMSTAPTKTIIEYIEVSSDVLEHCIAEYRTMAKSADAERIDKERLMEAWPVK